ncbi:hypothetical protein [Pseudomonas putida]|uniref:Uncharacterized protein n=1 Tax=Pseudomonas putida TaxID=303 RepID=A0A6I6XYT6_PSEPU|nr:hypothetical protein [Pseudomonas putida]QHG64460.1 hypothetical protein C2H86_08570 [Pseudomonas putida]
MQSSNAKDKADTMNAKLRKGGNKQTFTATEFETGTAFGNRWFNGIQGDPDASFSHIVLKLPESKIRQGAKFAIGDGEKASVSAYFGSSVFPYSGWAESGQMEIVQWDATSGLLKIYFTFLTAEGLEAEGSLDCTLLSLSKNETATNSVRASITPDLFSSLGDLVADDISLERSGDSSFLLIARQGKAPQLQGMRMTINPATNSIRAFFVIDNGLVNFLGGSSHFEWDEQASRLKGRLSGRKFSHLGREYTVDNAHISVTLGK